MARGRNKLRQRRATKIRAWSTPSWESMIGTAGSSLRQNTICGRKECPSPCHAIPVSSASEHDIHADGTKLHHLAWAAALAPIALAVRTSSPENVLCVPDASNCSFVASSPTRSVTHPHHPQNPLPDDDHPAVHRHTPVRAELVDPNRTTYRLEGDRATKELEQLDCCFSFKVVVCTRSLVWSRLVLPDYPRSDIIECHFRSLPRRPPSILDLDCSRGVTEALFSAAWRISAHTHPSHHPSLGHL